MTEYEPPEVTELGDIDEVTHAGNGSPVANGRKRGHRRGKGKGHDKGQGRGHESDSEWDWGWADDDWEW
jgi:hypothetical protein